MSLPSPPTAEPEQIIINNTTRIRRDFLGRRLDENITVKDVKDVDFNNIIFDPTLVVRCERGCSHRLRPCFWCGRQILYSHNDTYDEETKRLLKLDIRTGEEHRCISYRMCKMEEKGLI
jgi:hypothetical protein